MPDNFLEHYGMKGMKWGIRKARKASKTKSAKETAKTLTNKELKKRVDRLNMEKQYAELSNKRNETTLSRGKAFTSKVLKTAGQQKIQQLTNAAVSNVTDMAISSVKTSVKRDR